MKKLTANDTIAIICGAGIFISVFLPWNVTTSSMGIDTTSMGSNAFAANYAYGASVSMSGMQIGSMDIIITMLLGLVAVAGAYIQHKLSFIIGIVTALIGSLYAFGLNAISKGNVSLNSSYMTAQYSNKIGFGVY